MKSRWTCTLMLLLTSVAMGCTQTREFSGELNAMAQQDLAMWESWREMRSFYMRYGTEARLGDIAPFTQRKYLRHFGKGFREGFRDVAVGGTGRVPSLPPREYWSGWYRNPEGYMKAQAWFRGHRVGTAVAEQEGWEMWNRVPVASSVFRTQIADNANAIPAKLHREIPAAGSSATYPPRVSGPNAVQFSIGPPLVQGSGAQPDLPEFVPGGERQRAARITRSVAPLRSPTGPPSPVVGQNVANANPPQVVLFGTSGQMVTSPPQVVSQLGWRPVQRHRILHDVNPPTPQPD